MFEDDERGLKSEALRRRIRTGTIMVNRRKYKQRSIIPIITDSNL